MNQNFFRKTVLSAYDFTCCITGIRTEQLLIASHIKPWKDSSEDEKVNPRNGLCLNALHDKAFDRGFITLSETGQIIISDGMKDIYDGKVVEDYFGRYAGRQIFNPERFLPDKEFIKYHNEEIFENWKR